MSTKKITRNILMLFCCFSSLNLAAQGLYVSSGWDFYIHSPFNLATASGMTWQTQRSLTPGYISVGDTGQLLNASDSFNVNGYVKKIGNAAFNFPVGSGTDLRTLSIGAFGASSNAYATAWILGNPSTTPDPTDNDSFHSTTAMSSTIKQVSTIGQWDWIPVNGNPDGLPISVSIPNLSTFAPPGHLRLIGWEAANNRWVQIGAQAPTTATENTFISGVMQNGITAIGVGSIANGFPDFNITSSYDATSFATGSSRQIIVNVGEIRGNISGGAVSIRISKPAGFTINFDPNALTSTVLGGTAVKNTDWSMTETSTAMTLTLKDPNAIDAFATGKFFVTITRNSGSTLGAVLMTIRVNTSTGGDAVASNNVTTISLKRL